MVGTAIAQICCACTAGCRCPLPPASLRLVPRAVAPAVDLLAVLVAPRRPYARTWSSTLIGRASRGLRHRTRTESLPAPLARLEATVIAAMLGAEPDPTATRRRTLFGSGRPEPTCSISPPTAEQRSTVLRTARSLPAAIDRRSSPAKASSALFGAPSNARPGWRDGARGLRAAASERVPVAASPIIGPPRAWPR